MNILLHPPGSGETERSLRPKGRAGHGLILAGLAAWVGLAQAEEPAKGPADKSDEGIVVIRGADLYTISSGVIRNGTIIIKSNLITQIGQGIPIPDKATVLEARGKVVMPGLIAAYTESLDLAGSGQQKVIGDALDPYGAQVMFALASGITTVFAATGRPDPVGGTTAIVKMTYGDLESMVVKEPAAEKVDISNRRWLPKTNFLLQLNKARDYLRRLERYQKIKDTQKDAKEPSKPSDLEPYLRMLKRDLPVRIYAETAAEILAALELVDEFGLRLILEGAVEAWLVAGDIAKRNVPVIICPRHKREPDRQKSTPSGSSAENAAILRRAGVKFAIVPPATFSTTGGFAGRDLMTLTLEAAFAVRGGLDEQTALEAITLTAAQILGVADRVGSLQVGKEADLIILDGHPFHHKTFVESTFVNGKRLYQKDKSPLFSHHALPGRKGGTYWAACCGEHALPLLEVTALGGGKLGAGAVAAFDSELGQGPG